MILVPDIYPLIAEHIDWITLHKFKLVNIFFYNIYKKEKSKRLNSPYPFGEKNCKIKIVVDDDIYLKEIWCIIQNVEIKLNTEKIYMNYVHEILNSWFYYSFNSKNWFLTGNIIKSIIKLNKVLKNGDFDSLTFSFKNNKSFLYSIK